MDSQRRDIIHHAHISPIGEELFRVKSFLQIQSSNSSLILISAIKEIQRYVVVLTV